MTFKNAYFIFPHIPRYPKNVLGHFRSFGKKCKINIKFAFLGEIYKQKIRPYFDM